MTREEELNACRTILALWGCGDVNSFIKASEIAKALQEANEELDVQVYIQSVAVGKQPPYCSLRVVEKVTGEVIFHGDVVLSNSL